VYRGMRPQRHSASTCRGARRRGDRIERPCLVWVIRYRSLGDENLSMSAMP
jgi:hypothetical protein